jgi:large subunit ribosomal protein L23
MAIFNKIFQEDKAPEVEKKATDNKSAKPEAKTLSMPTMQSRILVRPVISEKSSNGAADNKYVFEVVKDANKFMVADAVQQTYGVRPEAVRVVTMPAKHRFRRRIKGTVGAWKKAIVTLPKGKSITIVEGV